MAAHFSGLSGPFVFDDVPAIKENPTIRSLWPINGPLSPPENSGVGGRPLANLSFALNYAFGGTDVRGYHLGSLGLHIATALLLFRIVGRTLRLVTGDDDDTTNGLAFATAVVWSVHPLTTASVSYLSQRTELLMALFYLLTLYAFIRGVTERRVGWMGVSVAACVLGMMSKEVMVSAPLLVLLYDRTFLAGTFREAWRQHGRFHLALAATWLVLGWLLTTGLSQRSVGFGLGVSPLAYALMEGRALLTYLGLTVWPASLVFDYGAVYSAGMLAPLIVLLLVGLAVVALVRQPKVGFLAASFFLLLAPTSSFVPVAEQPIAENRMYLPLATLLALGVTGAGSAIRGRMVVPLAAALALGALTMARNTDYRSELTLWSDTVQKRPENSRAQFNLGVALLDRGRAAEAATCFERSIQLKPREPKAHNSLGNALLELGRVADAVKAYSAAVRLDPNHGRAWLNYGTALLRGGDAIRAIDAFERAIRQSPGMAEAHSGLGNANFQLDRREQAIAHYRTALQLDPKLADAHYNWGSACLELGRVDEAITHFAAASEIKPGDAEIRNNLGVALLRKGRVAEAIAQWSEALRIKPDYVEAQGNLDIARKEMQRRN